MKHTLFLFLCVLLIFDCSITVQAQIIRTYGGSGIFGYGGDGGPATNAKLDSPSCILVDPTGNIYFTDQQNFCVRKIDAAGIITTVAGTGHPGFSGDNGPATAAMMESVWGVARDPAGNLYITDQDNYRVRKVNTAGIISTIAGSSVPGTSGDNGPASAARLLRPIGIAADAAGNIYIGDADAKTIRKIDPAGIISRFAGITGSFGYSGDGGPATNAQISLPYGLATDAMGNVYICDGGANCVRKVNPAGMITTVAGNGLPGSGGDGGPATSCNLNNPTGIFTDGSGQLYIIDNHNNKLRRVNPAGIISTIAGTGIAGFSGDGGLCTHAQFYRPTTSCVDQQNNIYITDSYNKRIRKISMVLFFSGAHTHTIHVCQNASSYSLDSLLAASDQALGLTDVWSLVSGPVAGTAHTNYSAPATGLTVIPSGTYYSPPPFFTGNDTFKVLITNGIATDTESIYVVVDPFLNNAGTITGDSLVCAGSSVTLTDSAPGGIWTTSNLNAVVSGGIVTGQSAGTDTITYAVTNSCGQASVSIVVTVNALPGAGVVTGADEVCVGASVFLTDNVNSGTWTSANNNAFIYPAPGNCQVTGVLPGRDTIWYTVSDSLCSASASKVIIVDPLPVAAISGQQPNLCSGTSIPVTGLPSGGLWSFVGNSANFTATGADGLLTGRMYGEDTLTYTVTNNCGIARAVYPFETDTLPGRPAITRNEAILYAPAGYANYQWLEDGNIVPGASADSIILKNTGHYNVFVTNAYGCIVASDTIDFPGCGAGEILIFPNPAESKIFISWCKKVTVRILCMDGRQVSMMREVNEVDLGDLPDAVYLLAIFDEHGKKLITKYITKLSH